METERRPPQIGQIIFTAVIGVFLVLNWRGLFTSLYGVDTAILLTIIGGHRIFFDALASLLRRQISVDLAIAIAAAAALAIGQYLAAAEVIFIMLIGESLESFAVSRTRVSIRRLLDLSPRMATIRRNGEEHEIPAERVRPGDIVIVRPGERIPVDGVVVDGSSSVNESTITGESMPADKHAGDEVYTGTLNELGALEIEARRVGEDTTLAKIIHLVEEAQEHRAPVQRLADRYATYFVPIVIVAAALTLVFTREMLRAVSVLIIACPCALVLATPTAVVASIGWLARRGILVKGGAYLEQVGRVDALLLDKTGTVTEGRPELAEVLTFREYSAESVLRLAASAEAPSEHLMARLIAAEARVRRLRVEAPEDFTVRPGLGVEARVAGERVLVGNRQLLAEGGVELPPEAADVVHSQEEDGRTVALVAAGGTLVGAVVVHDRPRAGARETISRLRELGLQDIALVTGDNERVARAVAAEVGITEFSADLLPDGKVEKVRELQGRGRTVVMVGDGVNDAPSLAAADVGIAMGTIGTDVTVEAADVVLIADELPRLAALVETSRRTLGTIRQNILYFAILFNFAAVMAAAFGYVQPVVAAVVHQVSSLLVVCNSLRLLLHRAQPPRAIARLWERASVLVEGAGGWLGGIDWGRGWGWLWAHRRRVGEWALAAAVALYALSGVFVVRPGEIAVVKFFGRVIRPAVTEGLRYRLPWPVASVTKVQATQMRAVEIGFRLRPGADAALASVPAYEWNIQHRSGRYERRPEEGLQFTGDHNLVEVNVVVHYSVHDPVAYLLNASEPDRLLRVAAASALRAVVGTCTLDDVLVAQRADIEQSVLQALRELAEGYKTGIAVHTVRLQDIHPPLEVVDAFRDVSSAEEDKARVINEAEAYANDVLPKAQGQKQADIIAAEAYAAAGVDRAQGAAAQFTPVAQAYRAGPKVTGLRLYLEALERSMSGLKKVIVDPKQRGRRQMIFLDSKGLRILPAAPAEQPAQPLPPAEALPPEPGEELPVLPTPEGGTAEAEVPPAE